MSYCMIVRLLFNWRQYMCVGCLLAFGSEVQGRGGRGSCGVGAV